MNKLEVLKNMLWGYLADVLDITLIVKPEVQRSPYGGELIKYERLLIAE